MEKHAVYTYADGKLPHQGGTSKIAAEAGLVKQESFAKQVFKHFVEVAAKGLTDCELIGITGNISARPRRIGLMHKGVVKDTGRRRLTMANRPAVVWALRCYCKEDEQDGREQQT
jgi:hypothetical protein